jgi:hypothetical protein
MTLSPSNIKPRTALSAFFLTLISIAIMLLAPDGAGATTPLHLGADTVPGTESVVVKVDGARQATGVSLYLDGHLAQHDRKWPWTFGRKGRIAVGHGRHTISVSARLPRHGEVHRAVVVSTPGPGSSNDSESSPTSSADPGREAWAGRSSESPLVKSERRPAISPSSPVSSPSPEPEAPSSPLVPEKTAPEESAAAPSGTTLWDGNYDTDSLFQWDLIQEAAPGRISVVKSPTDPENDVARFEVRPTDNIGDTSPRAEVGKYLGEKEGEERYYRWYTYFPESFPTNYPNSFVTFTQWRADDESEDYSSFMLWGNQIELRREGTKWSTELTKNVWHKFVYHVKWSPDPTVGFIELFYDGQLVLPKTYVRTMGGTVADPVENYVKQGLYKSEEIPTGVLYQDGFVSGTSYEAVNNATS